MYRSESNESKDCDYSDEGSGFQGSILLSENQASQLSGITTPSFGLNQWKLIFRASRDGYLAKHFHSNCDRYSPTLVIVKSDKKSVFGGYNPVHWNMAMGYYKATGAYIFGFMKKQIIKIMYNGKGQGGIYCAKKNGPCFNSGCDDGIWMADNSKFGRGCWVNLSKKYGYTTQKLKVKNVGPHFMNKGDWFFNVLDYEVFTPSLRERDLRTRIDYVIDERENYMTDFVNDVSISFHNVSISGIPKILFLL